MCNFIALKGGVIRFILMLSLALFTSCDGIKDLQKKETLPESVTSNTPVREVYIGDRDNIAAPQKGLVSPNPITGDKPIRGIYAGTSNNILALVKSAQSLGINAVVIDVKDEFGNITCDLDLPPIYKKNIRVRNIKKVIETLRNHGIYTIARIVTFRDHYAVLRFPDFAIKNKDGSVVVDKEKSSWLNPYNMNNPAKNVWDYIIQVAKAAAKVGFDEIQFDYIRFSPYKNPNVDLGPQSKSISKSEIINRFLDYAVQILHPLGVKISVDVFGCIIPGSLGEDTIVGAANIGQDWGHIARKVDYICPMIYPSHWPRESFGIKYPDHNPYHIVKVTMNLAIAAIKRDPEARAIIRPWLQAFTANWLPEKVYMIYSRKQVIDQSLAVTEAGLKGWTFWNPRGDYSPFISEKK
ncbi:MAG: putative glycoside hydrolase [Holosporales bacterium]|jgi:hypothetical protein|nr:putative glycoside hydrolase [Holosporales bacterium]